MELRKVREKEEGRRGKREEGKKKKQGGVKKQWREVARSRQKKYYKFAQILARILYWRSIHEKFSA
jgi:hypothetical protein